MHTQVLKGRAGLSIQGASVAQSSIDWVTVYPGHADAMPNTWERQNAISGCQFEAWVVELEATAGST